MTPAAPDREQVGTLTSRTGQTKRWSPLALMTLGVLFLQIAWVFAVPPFRGSDEFDHVYKAAAVARGDWVPSPTAATRGTGAWLDVPADLVEAANAQCEDLPYTKPVDCVGTTDGATTRVASGAGRYHPLYYALVGTPALPFDGYAALYVMRLVTVFFAWLLFCAALAATRTWARTNWPTATLAIAATPVLIYSSSVVAPNGIEMMAGLAFWTSAIGVARGVRPAHDGRLLLIAAVSGSLLVTTRSLGPLWCLMVAVTVLISVRPGTDRLRVLLSDRRTWCAGGVVTLAALASTAWILRMGSLNVGGEPKAPLSLPERLSLLSDDVVLWLLQSIAAFPLRNEQSEPVVYICFLLAFLFLVVVGLAAARGALRLGIILAILAASAVPFLISVATFNSHAEVWQGRYALPYAVGIALLIGLALDETGRRIGPRLRFAGLLLVLPGQVIGLVDVMARSLDKPLADSEHWVHPHVVLVAALALAASGSLWWGATARRVGVDEVAAPEPRQAP